MANLKRLLALIFSVLFLYTYTYTESHYRFVTLQEEPGDHDNSSSKISGTFLLHTFPYNNEEKNISSGKSAGHWFTKLTSEASQISIFHDNDRGPFRFLSRLIYSNEVHPNFTIRIKIFPFHYFL